VRTTLTLDPDVARMVEQEVHRVRKPFKQVVNDALRKGLTSTSAPKRASRYKVRPHSARLVPGIDRGRLNALADDLEDLTVAVKRAGRRR